MLVVLSVCFLAYVLWKTLEQWQRRAGLGNSPRTILQELGRIQSYAAAYAQGTNLILLDPDVAAVFPDAATVNEALRALMVIARLQKHPDTPVSRARKPASPRRQPH